MLEKIHFPVHLISPAESYRLVYVNAATCSHFDRTADELTKMSIPDWDPLFPLSRCEEHWKVLKVLKTNTVETLHLIKGMNEPVPVEVTSSYLEVGGEEFIMGFIQDISVRKKAEKEIQSLARRLKNSNDSLEQFAYLASHDLREPLRMVASFIQLLEKKYRQKLDDGALEYIRYAVQGVTRMGSMIDGLLEVSKLEHAHFKLKDLDFSALLTRVRSDLKIMIEDENAEIVVGPLPTARADELAMGQVFQNLISNAIKFRGELAPKIHITAEETADKFIFSVRDFGLGIEEKDQERVFQIFQRAHIDEKYPGNGLGLSICKRAVEGHGGKIWMESTPGQGSNFVFTLPKIK
jgi:PAS domain S-box-containing protein